MSSSFVTSVGSVRRSQSIFTYGVGAIVDLSRGSFMPLGLPQIDLYLSSLPNDVREAITIHEPRLERLLGVRRFYCMPVPGEKQLADFGKKVNRAWSIPCIRFPRWLECPDCHLLGKVNQPFEPQPDGSVNCSSCNARVTPVRFVVGCQSGHIEEFPWELKAHQGGTICDAPRLYLKSAGKTAALSDLYLECRNCSAQRTNLGDIFSAGPFPGIKCSGNQPWLLQNTDCDENVHTLQRGASNVYFTVSASIISIPPASQAIAKILEPRWSLLSGIPEAALEESVSSYLEAEGINLDPAMAMDWITKRRQMEDENELLDERAARRQEYDALSVSENPAVIAGQQPEFENAVEEIQGSLGQFVTHVSSVRRLREVRATCGFSRVISKPVSIESIPTAIEARQIASLSTGPYEWLPAMEVRGEGIFIKLAIDCLLPWECLESVKARAESINQIFMEDCEERGFEPPYEISPRLLLVHSLSHAMIRRLSLDCGYSSASLRERLYVSEVEGDDTGMAGLLIYTASPDSDGSLGGLVHHAAPERIGRIIRQAVEDAAWCGNDPVCRENDPRITGERLIGAACHNCMMISETSCERYNRELDRMMMIGGEDVAGQDVPGFFNGIMDAD